MESGPKQVLLKIAYARFPSSEVNSPTQVSVSVDASDLTAIFNKEGFISLLSARAIPSLAARNAPFITLLRKSKKSSRYVSMELEHDFKALHRSIRVKNHIKLLINDHSPIAPPTPVVQSAETSTSPSEGIAMGTRWEEFFLNSMGKVESFLNDFDRKLNDSSATSTSQGTSPGTRLAEFIMSSMNKIESFLNDFETRLNDSTGAGPTKNDQSSVSHNAVCDVCYPKSETQNPQCITGTRYSCLVCKDFDLCAKCEANQQNKKLTYGEHKHTHVMARVPVPQLYKAPVSSSFKIQNCEDIVLDITPDQLNNILHFMHSFGPFMDNYNKCVEKAHSLDELYDLVNITSPEKKFELIKSLIRDHFSTAEETAPLYEEATKDAPQYEEVEKKEELYGEENTIEKKNTIEKDNTIEYEKDNTIDEKDESDNEAVELDTPDEIPCNLLPVTGSSPETPGEDSVRVVPVPMCPYPQKYPIEVPDDAVLLHLKASDGYGATQLSFANKMSRTIKGGEFTFDFFTEKGDKPASSIRISQASDIAPNRSKFYNIGNLHLEPCTVVEVTTPECVFRGPFDGKEVAHLVAVSSQQTAQEEPAQTERSETIDVALATVSDSLHQFTITNNSSQALNCSGLKIDVEVDGTSVCSATVHKSSGILPGQSSRFNIPLKKANTQTPFKVGVSNAEYQGSVELNGEKMSGSLKEETNLKDSSVLYSSSIHSIVLPSLPRESPPSEKEELLGEEYDVVSSAETEGSDFEIL